jgi:hypothetical protein
LPTFFVLYLRLAVSPSISSFPFLLSSSPLF